MYTGHTKALRIITVRDRQDYLFQIFWALGGNANNFFQRTQMKLYHLEHLPKFNNYSLLHMYVWTCVVCTEPCTCGSFSYRQDIIILEVHNIIKLLQEDANARRPCMKWEHKYSRHFGKHSERCTWNRKAQYISWAIHLNGKSFPLDNLRVRVVPQDHCGSNY